MLDRPTTSLELLISDAADAAMLVLFVFVAGIALWVVSGR
jgi:hypothetical protein